MSTKDFRELMDLCEGLRLMESEIDGDTEIELEADEVIEMDNEYPDSYEFTTEWEELEGLLSRAHEIVNQPRFDRYLSDMDELYIAATSDELIKRLTDTLDAFQKIKREIEPEE